MEAKSSIERKITAAMTLPDDELERMLEPLIPIMAGIIYGDLEPNSQDSK